jgi:hypothetical protein
MLHAERQKSKNLKNAIEQAAEQLLDGMNGIEEDLPQAFVKLSKGHAAAMKTLLAVLAMVLVGCGGSAFSVGEGDDGGGDVVVRADGDDAGVRVVMPEAGTGEGGTVEAAPGDAASEAAEVDAGPTCLSTLSNVGTNDFRIAFTLTTTAGAIDMALVNQRMGCDQTSAFWDISYGGGGVGGATDDGTHFVLAQCVGAVNDGRSHRIVFARSAGILTCTLDGVAGAANADDFALDTMPPLKVGTDDCAGFGPIQGTIADVCLSRP